jgi:hypothetical protein
MQGFISILLYLLRPALLLKIWSILEKVPRVAEKNVCCAVAGWNNKWTNFLKISLNLTKNQRKTEKKDNSTQSSVVKNYTIDSI